MNSKYMMYSKDINHHLIKRPHPRIRHCLIRKSAAENMNTTGIKNLGNDMFFIKYYNNATQKTCQVNFGNDESMASCTCYSWRTYAYPCKHFFAIFKKFLAWGLDSLQSHYHNSPYLNLDEFDKSPLEDIHDNPVNLLELPGDGEDGKTKKIVSQDIPQRKNEMLK